MTLDEAIEHRVAFLTAYQNAAFASAYRGVVENVRVREQSVMPGRDDLGLAVARYLFKLMACKDEYEVARLYTDGTFEKRLAEQFEGDFRLRFHLAPPILGERDPATGNPRKRNYGPWMMTAFRLLAALRFVRGSLFDPFGHSAERRAERKLINDYRNMIADLLTSLTSANYGTAVAIASIPEDIRGYGHVKQAHMARARSRKASLLETFHHPEAAQVAAE